LLLIRELRQQSGGQGEGEAMYGQDLAVSLLRVLQRLQFESEAEQHVDEQSEFQRYLQHTPRVRVAQNIE
jgi:hypothetical protein